MAADKTLYSCPVCNAVVTSEDGVCRQCGFQLPSLHGTYTHFRYPEVPNAYQPSGKAPFMAVFLTIILMIFTGGAIGVGLIFLQYYFLKFFWGIGSVNLGPFRVLLFLIIIAFIFFIYSLAAGLLAWGVQQISIHHKIRNASVESLLRNFGGVVLCLGYALMGFSLPLFTRGLAGSDRTIFAGLALFGWGVLFWQLKKANSISEKPFCEICDAFMQQAVIGKYSTKDEGRLLSRLESGNFEPLDQGFKVTEKHNHCKLSLDYCDSCQAAGYVNLITTLAKYSVKGNSRGGKPSPRMESRRIYSGFVVPKDYSQIFSLHRLDEKKLQSE